MPIAPCSAHHLREGNFKEGWAEFEWRLRTEEFPHRPLPQPYWDGGSLAGKTILLLAEQGLGDTLQFIRYAPQLKAQAGARVVSGGPLLLFCPCSAPVPVWITS